MKKKSRRTAKNISPSSLYDWLPVEQWLIPSFHFTHVHGIARVFLIIEIVLSVAIVCGAIVLALLKFFL